MRRLIPKKTIRYKKLWLLPLTSGTRIHVPLWATHVCHMSQCRPYTVWAPHVHTCHCVPHTVYGHPAPFSAPLPCPIFLTTSKPPVARPPPFPACSRVLFPIFQHQVQFLQIQRFCTSTKAVFGFLWLRMVLESQNSANSLAINAKSYATAKPLRLESRRMSFFVSVVIQCENGKKNK